MMRRPYVLFAILGLANAALAQDSTHSSGWVVIPVGEYGSLRAKAFPADGEPAPPPVEATLTRIDYDLRIDGEVASGRASLAVDVLKDGWVRVPIPSGLLVREARLDGKLVSLVPSESGKSGAQLSAVLSKRGRSTLSLDIALPVASSGGEERLTLPSGASGITRAAVALPRQDIDVRLSGGILAEKSDSAAETKWLAYGRGNEQLTFTWRKKTEDHRATQPLRLRGSLTELVGLGEDSTSISAEVSLEVVQGAARQVRIQLPDKVAVNQVAGAMVADWEAKTGVLTVSFLEPVDQTARFVVSSEIRLPRDGAIEVPLLRLLDTERDSGGVAVEVLGAGEIKDHKAQGLEEADATDLGPAVASRQSPSMAAFRFRAGLANAARTLTVDVARYTQEAVLTANVEEARYRILVSDEGKTLVQARYAVRNNQRNFLKITLPAGAVVWSSALSNAPVRPGQAPDGSLLLPLAKARAGEEAPAFPVEILFLARDTAWTEKGKVALPLPTLDLPVSKTGLVVYYSPLFRLTPEPGSFRTEAYEQPSSAALSGLVVQVANEEIQRASPFPAQQAAGPGAGPGSGGRIGPGTVQGRETQSLFDQFRAKSDGRKTAGALPVRVSFPAVGPSLFLVSEITGENQRPSVDLSYQKEKKGGVR